MSSTPSEAALCWVPAGVDTIELQQLTTAFVRAVHGERAADTRGPGSATGRGGERLQVRARRAPPRLAALTHHLALVITQREIPNKGSEISELTTLAAELDRHGVIRDAPHNDRDSADIW